MSVLSANYRQSAGLDIGSNGEGTGVGAPPRAAQIGIIVICVLGALLGPALAATDVQGRAEELELRVDNASIGEVLSALSGKFKLTYSLPGNVGRQLTGRYSGSLNEVVGRVLDGNDYIVEVSDDAIKIVVLGGSMGSPRAAVVPATPKDGQSTPAATGTSPQPVARPAPAPSVPPLASYLTMSSMVGNESAP
jgi:hypothetical protein